MNPYSSNNYQDPRYHPIHGCKVPHVTLLFWIISIFAAVLGAAGGNAVSMSLNYGFGFSAGAFLLVLAALLTAQIAPPRFHPFVFWAVIVVATAVGTEFANFLNDNCNLGFGMSSLLAFCTLVAVLFIWKGSMGSVTFENICDPPHEAFYWFTTVICCTLGAGLWNYVFIQLGINLVASFVLFAILLAITGMFHFRPNSPSILLFWIAFSLSRSFGAGMGDILTRPGSEGGVNMSYGLVAILALIVMSLLIALTIRRHETPTEPIPA